MKKGGGKGPLKPWQPIQLKKKVPIPINFDQDKF